MKKNLFIFCLLLSTSIFAQMERRTSFVSVSGLPVFDVLKLFPENKIRGYGAIANLGFFPVKNLSIGFTPYIAQVSNSYNNSYISFYGTFRKEEKIRLMGINATLRYYLNQGKISFYPFISGGFANLDITSYKQEGNTKLSNDNKSVSIVMFGLGVNYFLTEKFTLELNLPYMYLQSFSHDYNDHVSFGTISPTLGIGFYIK
ncbi:MAG: outer membrane beta-barrel protein [Bacteroidota bacterium]|nr:outer membrane beta-barrel protein [Bacteroidota bacterium]